MITESSISKLEKTLDILTESNLLVQHMNYKDAKISNCCTKDQVWGIWEEVNYETKVYSMVFDDCICFSILCRLNGKLVHEINFTFSFEKNFRLMAV